MSGFAVIYDQSNTPVDPGVLERVMNRLSHRGPNGRDVKVDGHVAMGHWHFWTTPEEVEEKQPLELPGLPFTIVLDGRLDNRSGLLEEMGKRNPEYMLLSDAALMLHAYGQWGESCFEHFVGEYAMVIFDKYRGELICARDALGDRTLFYSQKGTRLVIASEPWAVAGAEDSPVELDRQSVSYYFALQTPESGKTLFKEIYELLPAHVMRISATGRNLRRYWQPDPSNSLRGKNDVEFAEEYRDLLEESIRCRLRATTPVGVLMSGGLDSTSVASLAARMIAPIQLKTISYVFDELPECDERNYIELVRKQYGIDSIQVPCDDCWPFKDWKNWPQNPNFPDGNAYRLVKERVYARTHAEGIRVLLNGMYGDELFCGEEDWLADLLTDGYWRKAFFEFKRHVTHIGLKTTIHSAYFRRAVKRVLGIRRNGQSIIHKKNVPAWLTPIAASYLEYKDERLSQQFELKGELLGIQTASDLSYETSNVSKHSLELRYPYRDRRLVEYVLSLPAYQLYGYGYSKFISRVAMQDIVPHEIVSRFQPTVFLSLFMRGIERERDSLDDHIKDGEASWRPYVRDVWLQENWNRKITRETDGPDAVVPWLCISFESWVHNTFLVK